MIKTFSDGRHKNQWESDTVFISNIPEEVQLKDLWRICKRIGRIRDIILPRKRNKSNKRYGFVKVFELHTVQIIKHLDGFQLHHNFLRAHRARIRIRSSVIDDKVTGVDKGNSRTICEGISINVDRQRPEVEELAKVQGHSKGNNITSFGASENSHNDIASPVIPLVINKNFEDLLKRSLVVETWKEDSFLAIKSIMDLLGFGDVEVKTMSSKTFLVTFPEGVSLEEVDIEFVGLGFLNIKLAEPEHLILLRQV